MGGSMDFTSTYKVTKVSEKDDHQKEAFGAGDYVVINGSCTTYYGQIINILPEDDEHYEEYIVQQIHLDTVRETTTSVYDASEYTFSKISEKQFMDMCAHYLNDKIEETKENITNEKAKLKKLTAYLRRTKNGKV
jgi:hypothetical protein